MRDIKFRGKHKSPYGDRWVRGYYALEDEEHVIIMPHSTSYEIALKEGSAIRTSSVKHTIDVNTLGQYTGLKDKNGTEIYEGDILQIPEWLQEDIQDKCICIYMQENQVSDIIGFGLYTKDGYSGKYKVLVPSDEWDEFEVIGNIYDNPELLEE